ncbi:geranylgeranylglyceryl/heptaprenylglyceryl phosphate synthase [Candidatus Bathyarchaeota archaeon]|nr:geranylgeranylglyceryl/heptaprenylglyceryl phosphate synthase [Candidatus Bathyarchaeota archaeon]
MNSKFKIGKTEMYLNKTLSERGFLHLLLVDPEKPGELSAVARAAEEAGTSAFMVGGSTAVMTEDYFEVISELKRSSRLPVIIFPSGPSSVARGADAMWFMSLLNSEDPYYIIGAQALGILAIKRLGMETIPMAYLIVGDGCTAGYIGRARSIPYDRPEIAGAFAMAAEALGMRFVYLEAGSGAKNPVPADFIAYVRKCISVPLIVGGGISSGKVSEDLIAGGADAIVTGTLFEQSKAAKEKMHEIIEGCKRGVNLRLNKVQSTIQDPAENRC